MPPSGYSNDQSSSISRFLRSCSEALEFEGTEKGLRPVEALRDECLDIDRALEAQSYDALVQSVLALTRAFYLDIASQNPSSYSEFRAAVHESVRKAESEILAVHLETGVLSL